MNMVEFFNRVAMLVATSILVEETAYLRAKAISKMIKVVFLVVYWTFYFLAYEGSV